MDRQGLVVEVYERLFIALRKCQAMLKTLQCKKRPMAWQSFQWVKSGIFPSKLNDLLQEPVDPNAEIEI